MNIKRSELQQLVFVILKTDVRFIGADEAVNSASVDELDIDFDLLENAENDHEYRVIYKVEAKRIDVNGNGLSICINAGCDFEVDKALDKDSKEFIQLVKYSATGITYNNIRNYLQTVTSFYPTPVYILPTIDLTDLWKNKIGSKPSEEEIQQT